MTTTLDQLREEFATPCPTLAAVRAKYFTHISSDKYLIRKINAGDIRLKFTRTGNSGKGTPVVYLHDLATYLDGLAQQAA